jgi:hypothetical protein
MPTVLPAVLWNRKWLEAVDEVMRLSKAKESDIDTVTIKVKYKNGGRSSRVLSAPSERAQS